MKINLLFQNKTLELAIDRPHYIRRLGYPKNYEVPEHVEESIQWAQQWYLENGNPWLGIYEVDVTYADEQLHLNNKRTEAPKVYKRFSKYGVQNAMLVASTAGGVVDDKTKELWSSDYPDRAFFLDCYAASVTEAVVTYGIEYIKQWAAQKGNKSLSRYSPGYPGWDLKNQFLLMDIISKDFQENIPITISDSALLAPLKSQLSLVGIHTNDKLEKPNNIACMQCSFMDCQCKDEEVFIKQIKNQ